MTNFGVGAFLDAIVDLSPPPLPRPAVQGARLPTDSDFAGFIFKIQANMNPRHRDRIAFMRVVSGMFDRGMEVRLSRTGKTLRLNKPHSFMASERAIVEDAAPGDIVGLYDPGQLRIGDTLYVGEEIQFEDIPRFAPEFFMRVRLKDPTRRKQLKSGLLQLSQEGTIQLFIQPALGASDPFLGAVGMLQFEVLQVRLKNEYKVNVVLEPAPFRVARWVTGDPAGLAWMAERGDYMVVEDRDGSPVVLAETSWMLEYATQQVPNMVLHDVSPL
jgi:peptide chain release factor 3